jgi:hypothetical protein
VNPTNGNWVIPCLKVKDFWVKYLGAPDSPLCSLSTFSKALDAEKDTAPKICYSKKKDKGTLCNVRAKTTRATLWLHSVCDCVLCMHSLARL